MICFGAAERRRQPWLFDAKPSDTEPIDVDAFDQSGFADEQVGVR
jgi:hypothetical protein